jgi:glycosyltransferase involved in cell wall biosynthesis
MHLIGMHLKKKTSIPWLADFRDPWTNIDFYKELLLSRRADRRHHKLEKRVVVTADCVLTVGNTMTKEFRELGGNKVYTLTNGFDMDDLPDDKVSEDEKFSIVHVGTIPKSRNSKTLWEVLAELAREEKGFKDQLIIRLIGRVDNSVVSSLKKCNLLSNVEMKSYLPHHEAIKLMKQSRVLLLLINNTPNAKGILTNKFFEYLSVQKPVLAIGPEDGDIAGILAETNAGNIVGYEDREKMKKVIAEYYYQYRTGESKMKFLTIDSYSRKNLTAKLAGILNEITH